MWFYLVQMNAGSYYPAVPLLYVNPRGIFAHMYLGIYTEMFIKALFEIEKNWK